MGRRLRSRRKAPRSRRSRMRRRRRSRLRNKLEERILPFLRSRDFPVAGLAVVSGIGWRAKATCLNEPSFAFYVLSYAGGEEREREGMRGRGIVRRGNGLRNPIQT